MKKYCLCATAISAARRRRSLYCGRCWTGRVWAESIPLPPPLPAARRSATPSIPPCARYWPPTAWTARARPHGSCGGGTMRTGTCSSAWMRRTSGTCAASSAGIRRASCTTSWTSRAFPGRRSPIPGTPGTLSGPMRTSTPPARGCSTT